MHVYAHVCGGPKLISYIFLDCPICCVLRQGLSLNLELKLTQAIKPEQACLHFLQHWDFVFEPDQA